MVVLSDTKVSIENGDQTVTGDEKLRLPPENGVLKIHILTPKSFLAFSGIVETAKSIINSLFNNKVDNTPQTIQKALIQTNDNTQFILGVIISERPVMVYVDKDKVEFGSTFHLGSHQAFNLFQKEYHNISEDIDPLNRTNRAFEEVIYRQNIPEVGDFIISASYELRMKSLMYDVRMEANGGYLPQKFEANERFVLDFGNVEEGSFFLSTLVSNNILKPAVCLYFILGGVAFLFLPISDNNSNLNPIILKPSDRKDLNNLVKNIYGISLIGFHLKGNEFSII